MLLPTRSSSSRSTRNDIDWVSASDIGSYEYCGRMFWLQKVHHVAPDAAGQRRLKAGTSNHHRHGVVYDAQRGFRRAALWALALTMLVAFLVWLFVRLTGGPV